MECMDTTTRDEDCRTGGPCLTPDRGAHLSTPFATVNKKGGKHSHSEGNELGRKGKMHEHGDTIVVG